MTKKNNNSSDTGQLANRQPDIDQNIQTLIYSLETHENDAIASWRHMLTLTLA